MTDDHFAVGRILLDTYVVRGVLGEGGMGRVYRVHHPGWGMDLALKTPRAEMVGIRGGFEAFEHEAQRWIDLGLHPNVTAAYYVRRIDGLPRIFAEVVEGGSLADALVRSGGSAIAFDPISILDLGIQIARGVAHAHSRGVVHSDLKPANVLLSLAGEAKITDFGLGITPAYCSPEQGSGVAPHAADDVWCWAATMLEVMIGDRTWSVGAAAPFVLEELRCGAIEPAIAMPESFLDIVGRCFVEREERPSVDVVLAGLFDCYRTVTGAAYPRTLATSSVQSPDDQSNRAVALLDLDRGEDAMAMLDRTIAAEPGHAPTAYNLQLARWRAGAIGDRVCIRRLRFLSEASDDARRYLGLLHAERGSRDEARDVGGIDLPEDSVLLSARFDLPDAPTLASIPSASGLALALRRKDGLGVVVVDAMARCSTLQTPSRVVALCLVRHGGVALVGLANGAVEVVELGTKSTTRLTAASPGVPPTAFDGVLLASDDVGVVVRLLDGDVDLWIRGGHRTLPVPRDDDVRAVALHAPSRMLVTGGNAIRFWSVDDGLVRTIDTSDQIACVGFTRDGRSLVAATHGGAVAVFRVNDGELGWLSLADGDDSTPATLSVGSDRCAVLRVDGSLRVHDLTNGRCALTLGSGAVAAPWLSGAVFDSEDRLLTTDARTLTRWSFPTRGMAAPFWIVRPATSASVSMAEARARASIDGARAAIASSDDRAAAAHFEALRSSPVPALHRTAEVAALHRELARRTWRGGLASAFVVQRAHLERPVRVGPFAIATGEVALVNEAGQRTQLPEGGSSEAPLRNQRLISGPSRAIDADDTGTVVSASADGWLVVTKSGQPAWRRRFVIGSTARSSQGEERVTSPLDLVEGTPLGFCDVRIVGDGTSAATLSIDFSVRIIELASGRVRVVHSDDGGAGLVNMLTASARGAALAERVATLRLSPTHRLDRLAAPRSMGLAVVPLLASDSPVLISTPESPTAVSCACDGMHAYAALPDGRLLTADARTGEVLSMTPLHGQALSALDVDAFGDLLAFGTVNGDLCVVDISTHRVVSVIREGASRICTIAFDPLGESLVFADDAGLARVVHLDWDVLFEEPATAQHRRLVVRSLADAWSCRRPTGPREMSRLLASMAMRAGLAGPSRGGRLGPGFGA